MCLRYNLSVFYSSYVDCLLHARLSKALRTELQTNQSQVLSSLKGGGGERKRERDRENKQNMNMTALNKNTKKETTGGIGKAEREGTLLCMGARDRLPGKDWVRRPGALREKHGGR